ncbi:DUF6456 domain-containing protein [soil metagenome]
MSADLAEAAFRLLSRLAVRGAVLARGGDGRWRLAGGGRAAGAIDPAAVAALEARGLIASEAGGLAISASGAAHLRRRMLGGDDAFAAQHQERGSVEIEDALLGRRRVTVNHDESPLAWLRRRKDRDGRPMVDATEFSAGERLRRDYERGQLIPRVTANWTTSVAAGRRDGAGGIADLTDAALGARRRVEAALVALGPELAGLAVDFCCFLKGLEEIERERQWPARSAKVVLRLALGCLARHYGISDRARGGERSPLRHWGTEGYRPTID